MISYKSQRLENTGWHINRASARSPALPLAGMAQLQYELAIPEEKRNLLQRVTSNRTVAPNDVDITLSFEFQEIANRRVSQYGARERSRTSTPLRALPPQGSVYAISPPAQVFR